jgi:Tfp pilus assembly protein PilP
VKYCLVFLVMFGGCAGERVKDLGDGMHSVTACSDDHITNSQVAATQAANKYCEKTEKEAVVDTFDDQACPKSDMSTTRVVFACR